jgi:hypothetical protein
MDASYENLPRDAKKLVFCSSRAGKLELREKSLVDGREAPIMAEGYTRIGPQGNEWQSFLARHES